MSALAEINTRWQEHLRRDSSLLLLGLAPMSSEDSAETKRALQDFTRGRAETLPRCLELFPAATATFLAVSAANSYHDGTFWPHLAAELGFNGSLTNQPQRTALIEAFRKSCHILNRPRWRAPLGAGFSHVSEFLFHAGFPVCHSRHLANAMRQLERSGELPSPDEVNADSDLRDRLVERLSFLPIPTMLRALRGAAGPLVARAALEVLVSGEYERLNPQLGVALRTAFNSRKIVVSGPRAQSPFLRLDEYISDVEIVCPPPDAHFVRSGHFGWIVNGQLHAWFANDPFVFKCGSADDIRLEPSGLRGDVNLGRTWKLSQFKRPEGLAQVFDGDSRRFRKTVPLSEKCADLNAGDHWVILPRGWRCSNPNVEIPWQAATAFHVTVQPRESLRFECNDKSFEFVSALAPVIVPQGAPFVVTHDQEKILIGKSLTLSVWLPDTSDRWVTTVSSGTVTSAYPCSINRGNDDWATCEIDVSAFVQTLRPGLHEIEISLLKDGKPKARRTVPFWAGCQSVSPTGTFTCSALPSNLDLPAGQGFEAKGNEFYPVNTSSVFRRIVFHIAGTKKEFRWRNEGNFVEIVVRVPGQPATVSPIALGDTIAASSDSAAFLRVWIAELESSSLLVNGRLREQIFGPQGSCEFSICDLALQHPHGGQIEVSAGSTPKLLVRFASPLQATKISKSSGSGVRSLDFDFAQPLGAVNVVCLELLSSRRVEFKPRPLKNQEPIKFEKPQFPSITLRSRVRSVVRPQLGTSLGDLLQQALAPKGAESGTTSGLSHIGVDIPLTGWPSGMWLVWVEASRPASATLEAVEDQNGKPTPLLIVSPPSSNANELSCVTHRAWQEAMANRETPWLNWNWTPESVSQAAGFIESVHAKYPNGLAGTLAGELAWVGLLERAVAAEAERMLEAGDTSAPVLLLGLTISHAGRQRLLRRPEVMAFPPQTYRALHLKDPALGALRQCAEVSEFDWFSQYVSEKPDSLSFEFLRRFSNHVDIMQNGPQDEMRGFDIRGYWRGLTSSTQTDSHFRPATGVDLLGADHWQASWHEFQRRCNEKSSLSGESEQLGYANACAQHAPVMLEFLRKSIANKNLVPADTWAAAWPVIETQFSFEENLPRLCSTFALAARAAGGGHLKFSTALDSLRGSLPKQSFVEGVRSLIELAPELFGFFLLFWQIMLKSESAYE